MSDHSSQLVESPKDMSNSQSSTPPNHPGQIQREITTHSLDTTDYKGPIIPPSDKKSQRTLVLCFDGTGDQFDNDNSNIVLFFSLLKKGDTSKQMVYYQAGIGTYTIPQIATPLYSTISKTMDMMFANNMDHHIMGGYAFLMENYQEGDRICIFGFSRGAYTARALAGMIHKVGLLPAANVQQVPFAYRMFTHDDPAGWKQSVLFKKTFSIDVPIDFVGVWDTVSSVGIIPKRLPFTKSNTSIRIFRHAMSLDEHRSKFKVSSWHKITRSEQLLVTGKHHTQRNLKIRRSHFGIRKHSQHTTHDVVAVAEDVVNVVGFVGKGAVKTVGVTGKAIGTVGKAVGNKVVPARIKFKREGSDTSGSDCDKKKKKDLEEDYQDEKENQTSVLEVWFAGCHCDVGGGSVANDTRHNLARIPLRWMIRQCFEANTGIQFEAERLREIGLRPEDLYPHVKRRPNTITLPPEAPEWKEAPKGVNRHKRAMEMMKAREKGEIWGQPEVPPTSPTVTVGSSSMPSSPTTAVNERFNDGTMVSRAESSRNKRFSLIDTFRNYKLGNLASDFSYSESTSSLSSDNDLPRLTEDEEDINDALCPVYDQLVLAKWWWLLEIWPIKEHKKKAGELVKDVTINLGHPRVLHDQKENGIKVHRSVKLRMEASGLCYKPKLKFHVEPEWVS